MPTACICSRGLLSATFGPIRRLQGGGLRPRFSTSWMQREFPGGTTTRILVALIYLNGQPSNGIRQRSFRYRNGPMTCSPTLLCPLEFSLSEQDLPEETSILAALSSWAPQPL